MLYDLKKLQRSLFNQKRRREVDPVLVQHHVKKYPDYMGKQYREKQRRPTNSGESLHDAVRVASYKEFAQVTGKVFEFNNDFRHIAPS